MHSLLTMVALKAQLSSVSDEHSMHLTASTEAVIVIVISSSRNPDVIVRITVASCVTA